MKKLKYLSFAVFLVFSFYLTDKIMIYIDNQSPLMKVIESVESDYNVKAVNAIIKDNTIIPGLKGKEINRHKSLLKMEEFGSFNETYLVYNMVDPSISLKDNKDKIIIRGNDSKREISLILEKNPLLEDYLNENNIKYNYLAKLNSNLSLDREYINAESDEKKFSDLDAILNKNSLNKNICFVNYSNPNSCQKKKYYLVRPSIDSNNKQYILEKINSGDIILINKNTSLETLKLILSEIKKLDLNIVYLSTLISE